MLQNDVGECCCYNIWGISNFPKTTPHFQITHNTPCFSCPIFHAHCLQFLLGIGNNAYANFWEGNKVNYGQSERANLSTCNLLLSSFIVLKTPTSDYEIIL